MKVYDLTEAAERLEELVDAAAKGEPFVIARDGRPLVKVVAYHAASRRIGFMKGSVPDDFDRMGEDEIAAMFGIE